MKIPLCAHILHEDMSAAYQLKSWEDAKTKSTVEVHRDNNI